MSGPAGLGATGVRRDRRGSLSRRSATPSTRSIRPLTAESGGHRLQQLLRVHTRQAPRQRPWSDPSRRSLGRSRSKGSSTIPRPTTSTTSSGRFPLEERLYRFRCVETWAMAVPWTGFQISHLIKEVDPKPEAQIHANGDRLSASTRCPASTSQPHYPWPYFEALEIKEAMNELAHLRHGHLRQARSQSKTARPIRLDHALEVRPEVDQVDRRNRVHQEAAARRFGPKWPPASTAGTPT